MIPGTAERAWNHRATWPFRGHLIFSFLPGTMTGCQSREESRDLWICAHQEEPVSLSLGRVFNIQNKSNKTQQDNIANNHPLSCSELINIQILLFCLTLKKQNITGKMENYLIASSPFSPPKCDTLECECVYVQSAKMTSTHSSFLHFHATVLIKRWSLLLLPLNLGL